MKIWGKLSLKLLNEKAVKRHWDFELQSHSRERKMDFIRVSGYNVSSKKQILDIFSKIVSKTKKII